MPSIATIAHRGTLFGLMGMSIWGLWLTAAVWKSRRGEGAMQGPRRDEIGVAQAVSREDQNQGLKGRAV